LIGRDLVKKFRQNWGITDVAGGEFGCPHFQRLLFNFNVDLAPHALFRTTVLASVSFTFAFDPGVLDQEV
jgi:hypothetical protein